MRRVNAVYKVYNPPADGIGGCWKAIECEGDFHGWHSRYEEFENGPGNYTVGLVELDNGSIVEVLPDTVRFIK
jgi:hypothetical protein